ncbi:hypothetical protein ASG67_04405 [Sphingomonas sp. Leaf339]|uniref:DUF3618 domain-containing protein n=1 Tax=Sphingomonas sp. Leaf339 TaxID=1736343 RepID=UPI000700BB98|nr:DUF3618 domain-containing protein [Sphingomonas sp. Leaf339]KQU62339.1 hypothetical protein ASG67_04405 [Sphingomonas sp. Leaf339]
MSDPRLDLVAAELQAAEARARLSGTVAQLQGRLDPKVIADDARQAGLDAVSAGVDGAKRHPGVVAGAMAAIGLLFARRRIAGALDKRRVSRPVPASPITRSKD